MEDIGGVDEGVERLSAATRARAVAEAVEWREMLVFADRLYAEYAATESYFLRKAQRASIALEIAVAMGLSEHQVHRRLSSARTLREHTPRLWLSFTDGGVDAHRATMIADTVDKLQRTESLMRLDRHVVTYAESHTATELRAWLKRFVSRVEGDLADERAQNERDKRTVDITHVEDAMSYLSAYLPTPVAAAIDRRLDREARAFTHDERTMAQRRADLIAAWATTNETGAPALGADIAVVIPAETLAGASDQPAVADDGTWTCPASWLRQYAGPHDTLWHRLLTDPAGQVLDHTYLGRYAPETLEKAIQFRDATCQAPTCAKPAEACDLDHRRPWPYGPTSGTNQWPLCRRHHQMKSHDVITWLLPSGARAPTEQPRHAPPSAEISHAEDTIARIVVDFAA